MCLNTLKEVGLVVGALVATWLVLVYGVGVIVGRFLEWCDHTSDATTKDSNSCER